MTDLPDAARSLPEIVFSPAELEQLQFDEVVQGIDGCNPRACPRLGEVWLRDHLLGMIGQLVRVAGTRTPPVSRIQIEQPSERLDVFGSDVRGRDGRNHLVTLVLRGGEEG